MPTLMYLGNTYDCTTAIKGEDYIHLLDENNVMVAAFDEITDFSEFTLQNGAYTSPTEDHNCYVAVVRDDGTIAKGGHTCADIGTAFQGVNELTPKVTNLETQVAKAASWELIDTIDNTVGYSGEWTAPDVFGDGQPYDLGVYMIGGGGSGGAASKAGQYTSGYALFSIGGGGASGYGKNFIIHNVFPNVKYSWVIGVKGTSVSANNNAINGKAGGSTSFNGETADGGNGGSAYGGGTSGGYGLNGAHGGQGADCTSISILQAKTNRCLYGCTETLHNDSRGQYGGLSQCAREGQNWFDPTMITLCAGGAAQNGNSQTILAMPDGTKGGNGVSDGSGEVTAESATGYGNGGGGASYYHSATPNVTATSGAGSDGVIYLYARKAVSE